MPPFQPPPVVAAHDPRGEEVIAGVQRSALGEHKPKGRADMTVCTVKPPSVIDGEDYIYGRAAMGRTAGKGDPFTVLQTDEPLVRLDCRVPLNNLDGHCHRFLRRRERSQLGNTPRSPVFSALEGELVGGAACGEDTQPHN